ncbi:MAG: addiction module protein [Spirochaetes bacterium]|nr:addiction module protein [Spirochaetota bacterium]
MKTSVLYDEILSLPINEKLELINKLLENINPVKKQKNRELWKDEIDKRIKDIEESKVSFISESELDHRVKEKNKS